MNYCAEIGAEMDDRQAVLIAAAIMMAPMIGAAAAGDGECTKALQSGEMRKDCMWQAVWLLDEIEKQKNAEERRGTQRNSHDYYAAATSPHRRSNSPQAATHGTRLRKRLP